MLRVYIYTSLIIAYILSSFIQSDILPYFVGILANITVFISLFYARGLYLYSGIIFYTLGIVLYFTTDGVSFLLQFHSMIGILALFLVLPFLNALIVVGRYDSHLSTLLQFKVRDIGDLYKRSSIVSHILGLFLNIATVPILIQSLQNTLKTFPDKLTKPFYAKSILRAYAFCLMWSPMEVMIIQTLEITGESYLIVFPFLLFLVGLFLFIDTTLGKRRHQDLTLPMNEVELSFQTSFRKIFELFVLLFILVGAVSILDLIIAQGYLFSLVLLMIPISLIWSWRLGKLKRYWAYTIPHWQVRTKGLANFYFMFISAGFFVMMLANTALLDMLQPFILRIADHSLLLFMMICIYFFLSSMIGFHPLVSIVLLAEILHPVLADISSIPLSIVLIISSLSTVMYSPFHISTSLLASEINVNPYRVGLWNMPFVLLLLSITVLFAYGLDRLLILF